ncbi:MAG: Holliday junction resolvase RuvX [Chthoniobacterales bacterium]
MKRVLGVDHGEARMGVALSDEAGFMAHALETIHVKTTNALNRLTELAQKHDVANIIIGLPRNMDGSYGPAAEKVRAFAEQLKGQISTPVILWDERMTTLQAQRALHDAGRNVKNSREVIDQVAAQTILQSWMDSQADFGMPM